MKIYVVIEYLPSYETDIKMVTTDYEKACKCLDEDRKHCAIEVWEDGATEGKLLD